MRILRGHEPIQGSKKGERRPTDSPMIDPSKLETADTKQSTLFHAKTCLGILENNEICDQIYVSEGFFVGAKPVSGFTILTRRSDCCCGVHGNNAWSRFSTATMRGARCSRRGQRAELSTRTCSHEAVCIHVPRR